MSLGLFVSHEKRSGDEPFPFLFGKKMNVGRPIIYTPYNYIDRDNVLEVVRKTFSKFQIVAGECQYLIDYNDNKQPSLRESVEKKVMSWIDFQLVDGIPDEIVSFWTGFSWGFPISYVQRGDSEQDNGKADGIAELNNNFSMAGNPKKLQELAYFLMRCGIGYTYVDINTEWEEGEAYFTKDVLDPRNTYIVRSSFFPDRRPILGVSCRKDEDNNFYITAFSKDERYEISARPIKKGKNTGRDDYYEKFYDFSHMIRSGEENPLHRIPIIEHIRDIDRTGVFEKKIPSIDTLNMMLSDIMNGIDQGIQAYFWTNDVDLEKEEVKDDEGNITLQSKKPKPGEWLHTQTLPNGTQPKIQPLYLDYHLGDMQNTYMSQRMLILQKCHVPQRNDNSGGSTGVAMDSATGWSDAENIASALENVTVGCQMEELKVVLSAIKESPDISQDNPMLSLLVSDIQLSIRRPKNFEITNKVNSIATLLSHGFSLEDCVSNIPLFQDATQVIARSGDGVRKYQETIWQEENEAEGGDGESAPNADRIMQDLSDQTDNSPALQNIS